MAIIRRGDCCDAVANSDAAGSAQFHVLAVDDCLVDRKVVERLLKASFYKVTAVESASRALEVLGVIEGEPPALNSYNDLKVNMIITDYCMPGMNGYDLLKKLKETKGLKEIPVVMMSSEDVPHRVNRCLAEGAEDFIMKPVQIGDIKKLRSHIKPPKAVCSTKRKVSSDRVAEKSSERRPRLNGVVVV